MNFKIFIYLLIFISFPIIWCVSDPINVPESNLPEVVIIIAVVIFIIILGRVIWRKK